MNESVQWTHFSINLKWLLLCVTPLVISGLFFFVVVKMSSCHVCIKFEPNWLTLTSVPIPQTCHVVHQNMYISNNDHLITAAISLRVGSSHARIMSCCFVPGCKSYKCRESEIFFYHIFKFHSFPNDQQLKKIPN